MTYHQPLPIDLQPESLGPIRGWRSRKRKAHGLEVDDYIPKPHKRKSKPIAKKPKPVVRSVSALNACLPRSSSEQVPGPK